MENFQRRMQLSLPRLFLAAALAFGSAAFAEPVQPVPPGLIDGVLGDDGLPLPLDGEGLPARVLSDAELYRVLLHVSRVMDEASLRLARCHAEGTPFGSPGWRACVERS